MSKTFATAVHLRKEDGSIVSFAAGDTAPKWVLPLITNDAIWAPAAETETEEESTESTEVGAGPGNTPSGDNVGGLIVTDTRPYVEQSGPELAKLAEARGLPASGGKKVLIARLEKADAAAVTPSTNVDTTVEVDEALAGDSRDREELVKALTDAGTEFDPEWTDAELAARLDA